ncbi:MAG TPA: hypothetical protein VGN12_07490 [Pirellulales bacterium]
MKPMHLEVMHGMRHLASQMRNLDGNFQATAMMAIDTCTACRRSMSRLLKVPANHLHCSLKLMEADGEEGRVATLGRSKPFDERPSKLGDDDGDLVTSSTTFASLLGMSDGVTLWSRDFTCFCCNDLKKQGTRFRCGRENWSNYYQSVLVLPLRYPRTCDGQDMGYIGFLMFDSPKVGTFAGLPEIFDYQNRAAEYLEELHSSPVFNLGAIFADTLATFLSSFYEVKHPHQKANEWQVKTLHQRSSEAERTKQPKRPPNGK